MKISLIALLLFGVSYSHCYVIKEDGEDTNPEPDVGEKDPQDMNKLLEDVSKSIFGDNTELIKEIAEEIDEEMSDSSMEAVEAMKRHFMASLLRLHEGGEMYRDARREAVLSALFSAFKETSDDVDQDFVSDLTKRLQQKEEQRRQQKSKEFGNNGLKTEDATDHSLQNK